MSGLVMLKYIEPNQNMSCAFGLQLQRVGYLIIKVGLAHPSPHVLTGPVDQSTNYRSFAQLQLGKLAKIQHKNKRFKQDWYCMSGTQECSSRKREEKSGIPTLLQSVNTVLKKFTCQCMKHFKGFPLLLGLSNTSSFSACVCVCVCHEMCIFFSISV